jgi:hypothetical protein
MMSMSMFDGRCELYNRFDLENVTKTKVLLLFGQTLTISPVFSKFLETLKSRPKTMSQERELFGRHATKAAIENPLVEFAARILIGAGDGKLMRLK